MEQKQAKKKGWVWGQGKGAKNVGHQNKKGGRGKDRGAPRARAPGSGKHRKPEATGAREGRGKERRNTKQKKKSKNKKHRKSEQPRPGGNRIEQKDKTATGHGEAHHNAPKRPARPTQPTRACTHTHTRAGPGRGILRAKRGGVGVHTKQPRSTGGVPRRKTDGTGNRTRQ